MTSAGSSFFEAADISRSSYIKSAPSRFYIRFLFYSLATAESVFDLLFFSTLPCLLPFKLPSTELGYDCFFDLRDSLEFLLAFLLYSAAETDLDADWLSDSDSSDSSSSSSLDSSSH